MVEPHPFQPLLRHVASFFRILPKADQDLFLKVWSAWLRSAADVRQHLAETSAAKGLYTIQPFQTHLNAALLFDPLQATYLRAIATGTLPRASYPEPGTNRFFIPVTGIQVGDVLVLETGAPHHSGDFVITHVLADGVVTTQVFEGETTESIDYRVDRGAAPDPKFVGCAEVYPIDGTFTSIPVLSTTVGPTGITLIEGADYMVDGGFIGFYSATPRQYLDGLSFFFAPQITADEELPYHVFGFPIGFRRPSGPEYVRGLQALYFALWMGPARFNVETGVSVLMGLPFTTPGIVQTVQQTDSGWRVVVESSGRTFSYELGAMFPPNVVAGQQVGFQALTAAARVIDYISDPDFIERFNLLPRLDKFHTFFVLIRYEVLSQFADADLAAVVDFTDRIRDARTNFHLLIELPIQENLNLVADAPLIDAVVMAHSMVGPNWANRMRIAHFASPGLADQYGYRDRWVLRSDVVGTISEARDAGDELYVLYTENADHQTPESGTLPGKFRMQLACSGRLSGSMDPGMWDGSATLVLSKAGFPQWPRVKAGDVLFTSGSAIVRNQRSFTIESVEETNLNIVITFDRAMAAEDGLSIDVQRLYSVKANVTGSPNVITLDPATLQLDGLNLSDPGAFSIWQRVQAGDDMFQDYEAAIDNGYFDFSDAVKRRAALIGCDAVALDDRVKITVYDSDDNVTSTYDERDELGSP